MPSPCAAREQIRAIASAVIMVPVGLAGLATSTPLSGALRCAAISISGVIAQRVGRRGLDQHRLAAERREDMAIGRIARHRDRDAIARIEQREERQDESGRRAGGDDDARRIDLDGVVLAHNGARCARAATGCRAPRYSRAGPRRARACAAAIALAGAGAAGCPTSMCTTCPPAASMRAAAAITSITMKGGHGAARRRRDQPFCRFQHRRRALACPAAQGHRPAAAAFVRTFCRTRLAAN